MSQKKSRAHRSRLLRRARLFLPNIQKVDDHPRHLLGPNIHELQQEPLF